MTEGIVRVLFMGLMGLVFYVGLITLFDWMAGKDKKEE